MPSVLPAYADLPEGVGWVTSLNRFQWVMEDQLSQLRARLLEHGKKHQAAQESIFAGFAKDQAEHVVLQSGVRDVPQKPKADSMKPAAFESETSASEDPTAVLLEPQDYQHNDSISQSTGSSFSMFGANTSCHCLGGIEEKWLHIVSRAIESSSSVYGEFAEHFVWLSVDKKFLSDDDYEGSRVMRSSTVRRASVVAREKSLRQVSRLKRRLIGLEMKAYHTGLRKPVSSISRESCIWTWTLVAHPYSCRLFLWMCLSLLCTLYDFVMVSMQPFDLFTPAALRASDWHIATFWTLDIAMGFTTGYYHQGRLEMRWRKVALYYVKRWFLVDVIIVVIAWLSVSLSLRHCRTSRSAARAVVLFRIGRLARMLSVRGLVRSINMRGLALSRSSMQLSTSHSLRGSVFVVGLVLFVHTCGCIWYLLGDHLQQGWVSKSDSVKRTGTAGASLHNYLLSMTWAMSALHGDLAFDDDCHGLEMLFGLAVSFISILVLAAFVSLLTNAMAEIIRQRNNALIKKRSVCAYLLKHEISVELAEKADNYIKMQALVHFQEDEADRQALDSLPRQLRRQLMAEARSHHLNWHPVFPFLQLTNMRLQITICCEAISQETFEERDDVFIMGESCVSTYFVVEGEFQLFGTLSSAARLFGSALLNGLDGACSDGNLVQSSTVSRFDSDSNEAACERMFSKWGQVVNEHEVVTEAALWMRCRHDRSLASLGNSVLYNVDTDGFLKFIRRDSTVLTTLAWYAHRFVMRAKDAMRFEDGWVLDLYNYRAVLSQERKAGISRHTTFHS